MGMGPAAPCAVPRWRTWRVVRPTQRWTFSDVCCTAHEHDRWVLTSMMPFAELSIAFVTAEGGGGGCRRSARGPCQRIAGKGCPLPVSPPHG